MNAGVKISLKFWKVLFTFNI